MQTANERQLNSGLLIVRLGIAVPLLIYAIPRLIGGARSWVPVGRDIRFLQADLPVQVIGLIILLIETLGALGLLTGYLFRICAAFLSLTYSLYFFNYIDVGYRTLPLYAGALACICIGLLFAGPGRFAVAVKIERK